MRFSWSSRKSLIQKYNKMTAVGESDSAMAAKCLDFCQVLVGQGLAFNFSLSINSTFSFSLDARGKGHAMAFQGKTKKRKTPSTLRRNARRRAEFLKKKQADSPVPEQGEDVSAKETVKEVAESDAFKCDQCESSFKSENGLKIHSGKAHKKVKNSATPERLRQQQDGSMSLCASPLLDASREETEEPTSPPQLHLPSSPLELPSACPGVFNEVGGGETGCGYCGYGWGKKCDWPWLKKQFRMTKEGLKAIEDD